MKDTYKTEAARGTPRSRYSELKRMLELSKGRRAVPVIVEGDKVTIGFGGT